MAAFGSKWLPNVTEPDDLVVVYVSTHGTPSQKDAERRNFIVAYDTEADDPYSTGVDMDEIYRRIKEGVKTDRALVVLDTCYSGGAVPGARGLGTFDNFDLSRIALGKGHLVISSSSVGERSWESQSYQNGVFTHNLIEALSQNSGTTTVKDAFEKLKTNVRWEVKRDFGQQQNPQMGGDWTGADLILSVTPASPRSAGTPNP